MDCLDLSLWGHQEGWPPAGPVVSGISFLGAGKGKATPYQKRCEQSSASFFVSCEATTGGYAAERPTATTVMLIKCLERTVLRSSFLH